MTINANTIDTVSNFFSIIFFIAGPKFPIKKAIIKNLEPLVKKRNYNKIKKIKVNKPTSNS